jgi:hypothetical protein
MNSNLNGHASRGQRAAILQYLLSGRPLTHAEAERLFGCARAAARVEELRRAGWPVRTDMVRAASGKTIACYRMDFGADFTPQADPAEGRASR